ncbi:THO complex subunit 4-like, partial [Homalodisca vitripennis]|uniref:THO complex subunit 4-like n=1 Tax=Homalodisca vitripennis TaxID=197043 RepID=UPI001EEA58B6
PLGDINTHCQHDLYDGPTLNNRRSGGLSMTGGPTKLVVTNLDYGVLSSDIQVKESRPMHIELTTSDVVVAMQQANRVSEGFTRRPSAGGFSHGVIGRGFRRNVRGEGRGYGQAAKNKVPTAAELDAELDAYISQRNLSAISTLAASMISMMARLSTTGGD